EMAIQAQDRFPMFTERMWVGTFASSRKANRRYEVGRVPMQSERGKFRELGRHLMRDQHAVRTTPHNIIRRDHLDWFEVESSANCEEAPNPFNLCGVRRVWKRIHHRNTCYHPLMSAPLLVTLHEGPIGLK